MVQSFVQASSRKKFEVAKASVVFVMFELKVGTSGDAGETFL
jgi:hypothetical protein